MAPKASKTKRGDGFELEGACRTCGAKMTLTRDHDCQKVKMEKAKAAKEASKAAAKHKATNSKLKRAPPPPPASSENTNTAPPKPTAGSGAVIASLPELCSRIRVINKSK
ncbi:hypothetical protein ACP70R_005100 [Stipagrostis hirtigluma subsp. patula]